MGPRSKRQRKQKNLQSVGRKHTVNYFTASEGTTAPPEGPTAEKQLERDVLDTNAVMLVPGLKGKMEETLGPVKKKLSKNQLRKLRRIGETKDDHQLREQLFATMERHAVAPEALALVRPVTQRGQRETKRQRLRRALGFQRAGLPVPAELELYRERTVRLPEDSEDESGASSSGEEDFGRAGAVSGGASAAVEMRGSDGNAMEEDDNAMDADDAEAKLGASDEEMAGEPPSQLDAAARRQQQAAVAAKMRQELGLPGLGPEPDPVALSAAPLDAGGPLRVVPVARRPEIEAARRELPIVAMEQEVMEALAAHDVIILCGATGCGKTTQVPQFLYEAGYGCRDFPERAGQIGVTQPRRVAATSTARRVADELNTRLGGTVGYQVRYDLKAGGGTALRFMTDGILLRDLTADFLLRKYSVVVIDEAHERSLNTDLLLGMLSRAVPLRRALAAEQAACPPADGSPPVTPLKLIIMSATLRTADFTHNPRLFPAPPPVISVPARQYPVTVHFARRTELRDYVGAAHQKVCKIHRQLPPGGILVFLTGQREVEHLCRRLRRALAPRAARRSTDPAAAPQQRAGGGGEVDGDEGEAGAAGDLAGTYDGDAAEIDRDGREGAADSDSEREWDEAGEEDPISEDEDEEETHVLGGEGFSAEELAAAEQRFTEQLGLAGKSGSPEGGASAAGGGEGGAAGDEAEADAGPVLVLPLYAMLPAAQQAHVFEPPPRGHRLIVVATNVAETSLTIPGIRYVVDAGRSKQRLLEEGSTLARFEVRWVSKAAAEQRAGRAGRTGPGHAYRLYSSALFNDTFPPHTPPEILSTPLEGVALVMRAMAIDRPARFPFPSPPDAAALAAAEACLAAIGALSGAPGGPLTERGRAMAGLPLDPRHARMLLEVAGPGSKSSKAKRQALPYAVALAAVMSVESPFVHLDGLTACEGEDEAALKARRQAARTAHAQFRNSDSDALGALAALRAYLAAPNRDEFCRQHVLHARNLKEAAALHTQLARCMAVLVAGKPGGGAASAPPDRGAAQALAAELVAGAVGPPPSPLVLAELRKAIAAGWADQIARRVRAAEYLAALAAQGGRAERRAVRYRTAAGLEEDVFLHPTCCLHSAAPEYVAYTQLLRTAKRPYMAGVTAIEPQWLAEAAAALCSFSAVLPEPPPTYSPERDAVIGWQRVTFSRREWELPLHALCPHPDAEERAAAFAAALLAGRVLPAFTGLKPLLVAAPALAAKPEARGQPRVGHLLSALVRRDVASRASLAAAWSAEPAFLKRELAAWLAKGAAKELDKLWPQLLAQSVVQAKKRKKGKAKELKRKL